MTRTKEPITAQGAQKLKEKIEQLKRVDRPNVIKAISEARKHGDLKENAEYHAAKEQQGFIEGRIMELEAALSNAEIIDISRLAGIDKVVFGATVHLFNVSENRSVAYQIVGHYEADIKTSKISINSPIARAIIGKHEGDLVEVQTPSGLVEYEVGEVEFI